MLNLWRVMVAVVALAALPVEAHAAPTVAIVVTDRVNISAGEEQSLVAALGRALESELVINVLPQGIVLRQLATVELKPGCLKDYGCIRKLVATVRADDILAVTLVRVGTAYQVDMTHINAASLGVVERTAIRLPAGADNFTNIFAASARLLLPHRAPTRQLTSGFWIASGVSVAALVVGTFLATRANSDLNACEDAQVPDLCTTDDLASVNDKALGADVAFGVAIGAATAAGLIYYFSGGRTPETTVVPTASANSMGVSLVSRF